MFILKLSGIQICFIKEIIEILHNKIFLIYILKLFLEEYIEQTL